MTRPTGPFFALGLAGSLVTLVSPALACDLPEEEPLAVEVCPFPPAPPPVVIRPWSVPPPPVVVRTIPVAPAVVVRPVTPTVVVRPYEPEPQPVVVEEQPIVDEPTSGTIDDRGAEVRRARRVVVGGGYGGLYFAGAESATLADALSLHLGVALGQASVSLRLSFAPDALELEKGQSASYAIGGLGFGYHFNAESLIHPVVGASLELHALDPDEDQARFGFGLGARAGLEMEYPLDSGSLGIGLDVTGHHRFGSEEHMPIASNAIGFGGTIDYRF